MAQRHRGVEFRMSRIQEAIAERPFYLVNGWPAYPDTETLVLHVAARMEGEEIVDRLEAACAELGIDVPTRTSRVRNQK